jgi:hypothetical protein
VSQLKETIEHKTARNKQVFHKTQNRNGFPIHRACTFNLIKKEKQNRERQAEQLLLLLFYCRNFFAALQAATTTERFVKLLKLYRFYDEREHYRFSDGKASHVGLLHVKWQYRAEQ